MRVHITVSVETPNVNFDIESVVHGHLREAIEKSAFYMLQQRFAVVVVAESRLAHGQDVTFVDIARHDMRVTP